MITKPVPAPLCAPTGHNPTSRTTPELATALVLADMVPGARVIRVSQLQPSQTWPSPYTRAYDERGQSMALSRTQRVTAARWVIRTYPELNWDETYDLDLATGVLRPAAEAYGNADGDR